MLGIVLALGLVCSRRSDCFRFGVSGACYGDLGVCQAGSREENRCRATFYREPTKAVVKAILLLGKKRSRALTKQTDCPQA